MSRIYQQKLFPDKVNTLIQRLQFEKSGASRTFSAPERDIIALMADQMDSAGIGLNCCSTLCCIY
jgi:hypothetical protein